MLNTREKIELLQNRIAEFQAKIDACNRELEILMEEEEVEREEKRLLEELEAVREKAKTIKAKKSPISKYRETKELDVLSELAGKKYSCYTSSLGRIYYVTSDGEFYSETKKLKTTIQQNGYEYVTIDGTAKLAHRVLWVAFNGDIPEGFEIDHINTIRTDNRLDNLRLATSSENKRNPLTIEKYKISNKNKGFNRNN